MNQLHAIAKRLGGEVVSGAISCPGPGHSRLDRSLRVYLDHQAPIGFRVHSHAGDGWEACQDHVADLLGIERWTPDIRGVGVPTPEKRNGEISTLAISGSPNSETLGNCRLALEIFSDTKSIVGTIGETYLQRRIGEVEISTPSDVRFHPSCPRGKAQRFPALVCLLRDIRTDEPRAIQRIFLQDDGRDRLRDAMGKATLGPATGAVIKLSPDAEVSTGLGICEGFEKAIALLANGWRPMWCTAGTSGMQSFPVLGGIDALTIFADRDEAGQNAAQKCGQRWSQVGRDVLIRSPRATKDWDEALRGAA